jgi:poly(A) polymerase
MERIEADWLTDPATQRVFALLGDAGHQVFAVGGCVRNTLLGAPVKDIDLSTDARPDRVVGLAKSAGLNVIPTGIDHGTVTVLANDVPFEITTFRKDVETDGRRAVVAFSDRIEDDARRRDFTMNALYVDAGGALLDPLGGLSDLHARRIRFIDDAVQRIHEDYLRSLRYFRFYAWYGDPDEGFDAEALDAIARNTNGLTGLSKERVGMEMKRLLEAPNPAPSVAGMRSTGVLMAILPGASDAALAPLVHLEAQVEAEPDAIRRLAVIDGEDLIERLRLSRKDADRLDKLRVNVGLSPSELGYRLGAGMARDVLLVSAASMGQPMSDADLTAVRHGATQEFPLRAADLMPDLEGPALGEALERLTADWIASGFELTKDELIARRRG